MARVESISLDGDQANLKLAMDPGQMSKIPSNARVEIKTTTVFGAKYVNIVIPDDPSTQPIQEGAVIASDSVTVEFNSVFEHLSGRTREDRTGKAQRHTRRDLHCTQRARRVAG